MKIECMIQPLMDEIVGDYCFLKRISPKNELLKYFVMKGSTFRNNHKLEISKEFSRRFWGDFPTYEELKEEEKDFTIEEYCLNLSLNLLLNYGMRLQGEIQMDLMKN